MCENILLYGTCPTLSGTFLVHQYTYYTFTTHILTNSLVSEWWKLAIFHNRFRSVYQDSLKMRYLHRLAILTQICSLFIVVIKLNNNTILHSDLLKTVIELRMFRIGLPVEQVIFYKRQNVIKFLSTYFTVRYITRAVKLVHMCTSSITINKEIKSCYKVEANIRTIFDKGHCLSIYWFTDQELLTKDLANIFRGQHVLYRSDSARVRSTDYLSASYGALDFQ